ncbi:hypothetical protein D3C71_1495910 [compost metagenome]
MTLAMVCGCSRNSMKRWALAAWGASLGMYRLSNQISEPSWGMKNDSLMALFASTARAWAVA